MTTDRDRNIELAAEFASVDGEVAGRALAELLREHDAVVRAMCRRFTGGRRQDSDELYQEFAVKLISCRSKFNPDRNWIAWASVVLRHQAIDRLAKQKTNRKHIKENEYELQVAVDSDRTVQHTAVINAMKMDSDDCVKQLAETAREMLLMREMHGMTLQAIAESFRLSGPSRAKSLCDKARMEVRECLERKGWTPEDLNDR